MEEFEYLVNACVKSKVKGNFTLRNGIKVDGECVEPTENEGVYVMYLTPTKKIYLDREGKVHPDKKSELDVVEFTKVS